MGPPVILMVILEDSPFERYPLATRRHTRFGLSSVLRQLVQILIRLPPTFLVCKFKNCQRFVWMLEWDRDEARRGPLPQRSHTRAIVVSK